MKNNPLIKKYGNEKQWVSWRYKTVGGRKTKVPYQTNGMPASSMNPDQWSTYNDVKKVSENVGIIFKPDQLLLGIDMDHVLEDGQIVHEEKQKIFEFIVEANTYCEYSPSKTGLHLYLALTEPLTLKQNKKAPYELYTKGRYFTTTLEPYGEVLDVRTVTPKECTDLLSILGYPWKEEVKEVTTPAATTKGYIRSDETIIKKMLKAKNGKEIEKLMSGDASNYKNDLSSADMALLSHLAFWTQRNTEQMERIWTSCALGKRDKTQKRKDYRDRSIKSAIEQCKEIYQTKPEKLESANPDLNLLYTFSKDKEKIFIKNTENICRILRHNKLFKEKFRYDSFKNIYEIKDTERDKWRILEDNDAVVAQTEISILFPDYFGTVGKDMVYDAIVKISKEHSFDSASDYIKGLEWDGEKRLDFWLSEVYGCTVDRYHTAVGSNWLKGLVKRIIEPGCKFDYVLVLEGPQGSKKSTSLNVLGGDWHVETTMSTDSKDFFMQFQGKAIIEFSEGETLNRTEVKRMKAIITTQTDKYRMPYERSSQDYPRRCVFAMTTNQEEYLKDETGNRRWLPVKLTMAEANVEWLQENREQLFAEAYQRVIVDKETVYEFPKEETLVAQDARRVLDANQDMIIAWYYEKLTPQDRNNGVTIYQVYRDAINNGYPGKPLDKYNEMRISEVLRNTLHLNRERKRIGGAFTSVWMQTVKEEVNEFDKIVDNW